MRFLLVSISLLLLISRAFAQGEVPLNFGNGGNLFNNANGNNSIVANDLFTGTANINIPIYSNNITGATVNISLNYNTKGIKVDEIASIAGLGWQLFYGGGIFRNMKGIPDEYFFDPGNGGTPRRGYWHLDKSGIDFTDQLTLNAFDVNILDGQPDIFTAVFGGKSINFLFSDNNTLVTIPHNPRIKIERTVNGSPISTFQKGSSATLGFIITDETGAKYYFIEGDKMKSDAWSVHIDNDPQGAYTTTLTWILDKIVNYEGQEIDFTYDESQEVTYSPSITQNYMEIIEGCLGIRDQPFGILHTTFNEYIGKFKLIKTIEFPDSKVVFNYNDESDPNKVRKDVNGLKALKDIEIRNPLTNATVFKYKLHQAYFNSESWQPAEAAFSTQTYQPGDHSSEFYRLKLKKITIEAGGLEKPYYEFDYYTDVRLTHRTDNEQDYWGYNKIGAMQYYPFTTFIPGQNFSAHGFSDIIPTEYHNLYFPPLNEPNFDNATMLMGISRTPEVSSIRAFTLKKVTNQYGGWQEFFYESPIVQFNSGSGTSEKADGLRLSKIILKDDFKAGGFTETIFEYEGGHYFYPGNNTQSFAITDLFKRHIEVQSPSACGTLPNPVFTTTFNSISSKAMTLSDFAVQHGYNKVTVKSYYKQDVNSPGEYHGKTEHYFSNIRNVPPNTDISSSSVSGQTLNVNSTNFILTPSPYTSSLFNKTASNYHRQYDEQPFTDRTYVASWAIGLPWKTSVFDHNDQLVAETRNQYDIHIRTLDADEFLCLNTCKDFLFPTNVLNENFVNNFFYPYTGHVRLDRTEQENFLNNGSQLVLKNFGYDDLGSLKRSSSYTSEGDIIEEVTEYSLDFANTTNPSIAELVNKNINVPVWSFSQRLWSNVVKGATGFGLFNDNGKIRINHSFRLKVPTPANTNYTWFDINLASNNTLGSQWELISTNEKYDSRGRVLQVVSKGRRTSYVYDKVYNDLIAEVVNSGYDECAYTSFENIATTNYNSHEEYGNWFFNVNSSLINTSEAFTGAQCIELTATSSMWSKSGLTTGEQYVVSFWQKNGSISANDGVTPLTMSTGPTINGWTYKQATFTAVSPTSSSHTGIGLWGNGLIDELRLYPRDAQMTTTTFKPFCGVSTKCDQNNIVTRFEYDPFCNLTVTRDQFGNILEKSVHVIQGND